MYFLRYLALLFESHNKVESHSPLRVGEDELPQLEISEHDALVVARSHWLRHLPKEPPRLGLPQPPPVPDVGVQVSVGEWEHQVGELVTQQHLVEGVDVRVAVEAVVGRQQRVSILGDHLQTQRCYGNCKTLE